jgi:hypothetical protein
VYKCSALFPPADKSLKLGRKNLHLFRWGQLGRNLQRVGAVLPVTAVAAVLDFCR